MYMEFKMEYRRRYHQPERSVVPEQDDGLGRLGVLEPGQIGIAAVALVGSCFGLNDRLDYSRHRMVRRRCCRCGRRAFSFRWR